MHLSLAELQRSAPDALRGLGLSIGQADDAVEPIVLSQAAFGAAYEVLREAEAARNPKGWTLPSIERDKQETRIGLHGQSLLFFAARIADYVATRQNGHLVTVYDVTGRKLAPYVCFRAARQNRVIAAIWQGSGGERNGQFVALPNGASFPIYAIDAPKVWNSVVRHMGAERVSLEEPARSVPTLRLVASDGPLDIKMLTKYAVDRVDFDDARQHAIDQGFEINRDDYAFYQSLMARVRVPTSERSRAQAG